MCRLSFTSEAGRPVSITCANTARMRKHTQSHPHHAIAHTLHTHSTHFTHTPHTPHTSHALHTLTSRLSFLKISPLFIFTLSPPAPPSCLKEPPSLPPPPLPPRANFCPKTVSPTCIQHDAAAADASDACVWAHLMEKYFHVAVADVLPVLVLHCPLGL